MSWKQSINYYTYEPKKKEKQDEKLRLSVASNVTSPCCISPRVLQPPLLPLPVLLLASLFAYPTLATFHCSDSHWMENSWTRDCLEHIMPKFSMNSHLALPSPPLSSALPCSLSSFKGGAVQLKQKKNSLYENMLLTHIWYSPSPPSFCEFLSQPYSLVILWCYGWFCFWQVEKRGDRRQLSYTHRYSYG